MSMKTPTHDWRERFDGLFYQQGSGKWMSRGGESYDSVTPEMGRGELFRFIQKEIEAAEKRGENREKERIAVAGKVSASLDENDIPSKDDLENNDKETIFTAGYALGREKVLELLAPNN